MKRQILLYGALFMAAFLLFALLRVPSDRLARVAVAHVESAGYKVTYDRTRGTLLPGFRLQGVQVFNAQNDQAENPLVELESVSARAALLPLLTGRAAVRLGFDMYGGSGNIRVAHRGETTWVSGRWDDVSLRDIEPLQERLQTPLHGVVDGRVDMELYPRMIQHVGTISLTLGGLRLDPGHLLGAFEIPAIDFGDVHGSVFLENNQLIFDRFGGDGQDVKLRVEGRVQLAQPFANSRLDLNINSNISSRVEQALGFAFPLMGMVKNPQGEYVRRLTGTIAAPR